MSGYRVVVNDFELKNELYYKNTPVLTYSIRYPQFSSSRFRLFTKRLNLYYRDKAHAWAQYCESIFYGMAMAYYDDTVKDNYPFHMYTFYVTFAVTNNQDCILSLYFDEDRYTGGANGTTERSADSWDMSKGKRIVLHELYLCSGDFVTGIEDEINKLIAERIKNEDSSFFPEYQMLVKEHFDPNNFYLSPQALVIYFQEVTIAPHASSIVPFEIPFICGPVKPIPCPC